ncbi:MAG TPA: multidrug effflux MFS transporter [Pseudonocardiaceae bacterium]
MRKKYESAPGRFFPALLIASMVATIIEIDMSVPSFPDIARSLGVTDSAVQLTITLNFLGYCLGALVYGPLSDRFGRRSVMLVGNSIMLVGAIGCAVAPSIEFLLASRFVQGVGASTSVVLVFVMISDLYKGEAAIPLYGLTNAAMSILMTIAPPLGGVVNQTIGWRGNYAVVAGITTVSLLLMALFLPETRKEVVPVSAGKVVADYRKLVTSGAFVATSLVPSLLFAAYMVFIASSSFVYTGTFGLSVTAFAVNLLVVVASFAVTSLFAARLIPVLGGPERTVQYSIATAVLGVVLFLLFGDGPVVTTAAIALFCVGFAVCYPVVFGRSLEVFPELGGAASSLTMSSRALMVTLLTGLSGSLFTGSPVVPAAVMTATVLVVAPLALFGGRLLTARAKVPEPSSS